ncbi:hypothetical protein [Photobacterium sp. TY1-4]|uniref:hypothetical protein n=1 Tax=Photobacterium sp. TY1-4 TaxID=2899122 RepID=UPI0021BFA472|nr:hypothetical protein [Photobacterium sp. TY1-4]UXH99938.1 hypothetical protein NH461_08820 [Photobacterium sp. TY1-4]
MKNIIILAAVLSLAGCAAKPKKEYEWVNTTGEVAQLEALQVAKDSCNYDANLKAIQDYVYLAISVGRYESKYDTSTSDGYVKQASELMTQNASCMKEAGFTRREKVATNAAS